MVKLALLALCLVLATATAQDAAHSPISKVVKMLKDMRSQLEKEVEADEETFDKIACWCETNEKEKTKAIAMNTQKVAQLEASVEELFATSKALQAKIDVTHDDLQKNNGGKTEAREIRMKEEKEFHSEETDLVQAIKGLEGAVVALSKHNEEGLVEKKAVLSKVVLAHKEMISASLDSSSMEALNTFLSGNSLVQTTSSLRRATVHQPAVMSSYSSQSGEIFGVLKQMKKTFEENLVELRKNEMASVNSYKEMMSSKGDEITANKKQLAEAKANKAETDENLVAAKKDLKQTKAILAEDIAFLQKLKETCKRNAEEYEVRKQDRADEIAGVGETIQILNNDEAFELMGKSLPASFAQMKITTSISFALKRKALAHLRVKARELKSSQLAQFAQQLSLDAFEKVKTAIDNMITELKTQNADEIKQKDVCVAQFAENAKETAVNEDQKKDLISKIDTLKQSVMTLTKDIKLLKEDNENSKTQMKRAGDDRGAENAEFQQTIFDQRATQEILKRAMARMVQVYKQEEAAASGTTPAPAAAFLEEGYTPLSGDQPAKFAEYNQNKGGNRVVAMLEKVIKEAQATEKEAVKDETDAQATYETMMKDSNAAIKQKMSAITEKSAQLAKAQEDLSIAADDLHSTLDQLEGLYKEKGDIHQECDFVMKNFKIRQSARTNEIEALGQAKSILSGAK